MTDQVSHGPRARSKDREDERLHDAAEDVSDAVLAASRLFMAISARALAAIDPALTLPQLRTLVVLHGEGPVKLAALAAALDVNPSTAMRMVDKLEAHGLVDRQVNPGNRREVILRLTRDGRHLVDQVMAHRHREIAEIVGRLPARRRTDLVRSLRELIAAADEPALGMPEDARHG
ncbi:MarR family winged helix-turn-helix transcriptional regulator [Streptantibioticus cattleyicolor]|uniref:Transcriptional regulator, MarR family n=1 Tax=Streptantibioticus cattleyicolor (strain ATCC 35852 / DSM 46488 / JCM 4925 / NBRC 14057 / NRRL 8057) TaxID=1003195 RepID=F8JM51_STREN|nr:MarR family transcriptional regulator [Streptantibioticus cattleyicolor]AEW99426.1 transcriptional regulator, MarR family [Streptantibioticus cattleyicolor NRRL 8057 = DSM 46488]CCB71534.1 putative MarR-family transcriptional regulator [Streptantibioticus cattleyicolor NRRL 8057 = DSM 46488]